MAVEGVNNAYYSSTASAQEKRQVGDELGKDAFLQILVAQMAQFSSLEQMQNLNASMSTQAAYSYMGKDVTAEHAMDTEGNLYAQSVYGTVIGVSHFNGGNYLQVEDHTTGEIVLVAPDQVLQTIDRNPVQNQLNQLLAMMGQVVANTERSASAAEAAAATEEESVPTVEETTEAGDTVTEDDAAGDNTDAGTTQVEGGGEAAADDSAAL